MRSTKRKNFLSVASGMFDDNEALCDVMGFRLLSIADFAIASRELRILLCVKCNNKENARIAAQVTSDEFLS